MNRVDTDENGVCGGRGEGQRRKRRLAQASSVGASMRYYSDGKFNGFTTCATSLLYSVYERHPNTMFRLKSEEKMPHSDFFSKVRPRIREAAAGFRSTASFGLIS